MLKLIRDRLKKLYQDENKVLFAKKTIKNNIIKSLLYRIVVRKN